MESTAVRKYSLRNSTRYFVSTLFFCLLNHCIQHTIITQHIIRSTRSHICEQNKIQTSNTIHAWRDQLPAIKHCWTLSFQVYICTGAADMSFQCSERRGLGVKAASICFAISLIAAFVLAIIARRECRSSIGKERAERATGYSCEHEQLFPAQLNGSSSPC